MSRQASMTTSALHLVQVLLREEQGQDILQQRREFRQMVHYNRELQIEGMYITFERIRMFHENRQD